MSRWPVAKDFGYFWEEKHLWRYDRPASPRPAISWLTLLLGVAAARFYDTIIFTGGGAGAGGAAAGWCNVAGRTQDAGKCKIINIITQQ